MEIKTTIIIPNYNGLSFMEPCFESLKEQTVRDFKVLVVDNGSTDGSVEWLKEHRVPSIFLKENTGFSGAVNTGIRAADTPYVLLLNNDTRVEPGFVAAMERAMDPITPKKRVNAHFPFFQKSFLPITMDTTNVVTGRIIQRNIKL